MGNLGVIRSIALLSIILQVSCGGVSNARSASTKTGIGIQNIIPTASADSLKISLLTEIDLDGNQTPHLSISLKDRDDQGERWSTMLGNRFRVVIGSTNYVVELNNDSGDFEAVAIPQIPLSTFASHFNQPVSITTMDGSPLGSPIITPQIPAALSDLNSPFSSFSQRRTISRCRILPNDPAPGIFWANSSSANFEIQLDSYSASIPDIGYWRPTEDIFYLFYFPEDMEWADNYFEILPPVRTTVGLNRHYDDRQIRLSTTVQRDLTVKTYALQIADYPLVYVGACF